LQHRLRLLARGVQRIFAARSVSVEKCFADAAIGTCELSFWLGLVIFLRGIKGRDDLYAVFDQFLASAKFCLPIGPL
jgi:hypothetical protein